MIINKEDVNQIVPLNPEMQVSELLSIELDIWKYITSYLSFSDKAALRLVCHFFLRAVLCSPPAWEQWVSVNDIQAFQQKNKEFGWGDRPIYGVFLPHYGITAPEWSGSLPSFLPALDVSARQPKLYFNFKVSKLPVLRKNLPKELKVNYFPDFTEEQVKYFFRTHHHLHLHLEGANLLWWACYFGWEDIVKEIIYQIKEKTGPYSLLDINKGNGFYSPLAIAAQKNHIEILSLLIEQGADINQCCKSGTTPLMVAIQQGHVEAVIFLLEQGAKVNERDKDNQTPLMMSYFYQNEKDKNYQIITKLLIAYGANCYQQNTDEKIELLDSWITSYNENNEIFLQEAIEVSISLPQFFISNTAQIPTEVFAKFKQWLYGICDRIGRDHAESRRMAHQAILWFEYISLNKFSFSLEFSPQHLNLYCLLLVDYYIDGSIELRVRCPTKNLIDLTTNIYKKHEVYRLRCEILGLNLRKTLTIKTPLLIIEKIFSFFPQLPLVEQVAFQLLNAFHLQFNSVRQRRDAIAAATVAVARYWVTQKQEDLWPQEYASKLKMPFESFKKEYDIMYVVAYRMNQENLAKKKAQEAKISEKNNTNPPSNSMPNSNSSNVQQNNVQVSTHRASFFNENNVQNGDKDITDENDVIYDPQNTHK